MTNSVDDDPNLIAAAGGARRLIEILKDTKDDIDQMPIFVRPMAKRGYQKRTGMSLGQWERFAEDLQRRLNGDRYRAKTIRPDTISFLERLIDNYKTAPQRAARFMRDPALMDVIRQRTAERQRSIEGLISALRALGVG